MRRPRIHRRGIRYAAPNPASTRRKNANPKRRDSIKPVFSLAIAPKSLLTQNKDS